VIVSAKCEGVWSESASEDIDDADENPELFDIEGIILLIILILLSLTLLTLSSIIVILDSTDWCLSSTDIENLTDLFVIFLLSSLGSSIEDNRQ